MPQQPRRRETMGEIYARVWPDATPELMAQVIEMFGPPEAEVGSIMDVIRSLEGDNGDQAQSQPLE